MNSKNRSIKKIARNAVAAAKRHFTTQAPQPVIQALPSVSLLPVQIAIIKNSRWQSAEGEAQLNEMVELAERVLNIKININIHRNHETPVKTFPSGLWNGKHNYHPDIIKLFNEIGISNQLTILLCDEIEHLCAIAVVKSMVGSEDKLSKEGIIISADANELALAKMLALVLSGTTMQDSSDDINNLLCMFSNDGEEWTKPWQLSAMKSHYLQ